MKFMRDVSVGMRSVELAGQVLLEIVAVAYNRSRYAFDMGAIG